MRRTLSIALAALCGLAVAAPSAGAVTYGISDQQASTFQSPFYKPLKLKIARYHPPYDVMDDPAQLQRWDAWYKAATTAKQRILVSFEHSRASAAKARKAPSVAAYTRAIKKFKKAYPKVKEINSWNEVNRCQQGSRTEGQPKKLCRGTSGAKLAAQYYMAARKVFKGSKIIGLNVLDENNPNAALKYIKAFKRFAKPTPKIWGLHNYSDTNRGSTTRTSKIIKAFGKGEVWLLETGGQLTFQNQGEAGAAKAIRCTFTIAKKFKAIKRVYFYNWTAAAPGASFDSGLVDLNGQPRLGYQDVLKRKSGKCGK